MTDVMDDYQAILIQIMEDLTTYEKYDPDTCGCFTVNPDIVTFDVERQERASIYKDFANSVLYFEHLFAFNVASTSDVNGAFAPWAITPSDCYTYWDYWRYNRHAIGVNIDIPTYNPTQYRVNLRDFSKYPELVHCWLAFHEFDTTYYARVKRESDTSIELSTYIDPQRSELHSTCNIPMDHTTKYPRLHGFSSRGGDPHNPIPAIQGWTGNIAIVS